MILVGPIPTPPRSKPWWDDSMREFPHVNREDLSRGSLDGTIKFHSKVLFEEVTS